MIIKLVHYNGSDKKSGYEEVYECFNYELVLTNERHTDILYLNNGYISIMFDQSITNMYVINDEGNIRTTDHYQFKYNFVACEKEKVLSSD